MSTTIGHVVQLPFRQAFLYGARSQTAWLEKNLHTLSERLKLPLLIEARDVYLDNFRIDLLCTDVQGNRVLVKTQHNPQEQGELSRLMHYMEKTRTNTVIWLTPEPYHEHIEAITYLNAMTSGENQFYLLKVEAVRIADSPPAPLFHVLAHPGQHSLLIETQKNLEVGASTTIPVRPMPGKGNPAVWCAAPRRDAETHALFTQQGIVGLCISKLGDLHRIEPSLLAFKQAYKNTDPFHADHITSDIYHTLYNFTYEVAQGDYVVYLPTWYEDCIYMGEITGPYIHTPHQADGYIDWRPVKWLLYTAPKAAFTPEALEALTPRKAFFRVHSSTFAEQLRRQLG